jgi:hypothetical protein
LTGQLHAVADAQHGDVEIEQVRIAARGAGSIDAGRAAGENQAARFQLGHALRRDVVADDLTKDVQLADAAGDELAVLRAEIKDEDAFAFGSCCHDSPFRLTQLGGALRRRLDRIHERAADAAAFQRVQAGDGGAAGTGHHVLENAGMTSRFQHHLRRS